MESVDANVLGPEEMLRRLGLHEATLVHYDIRDTNAGAKSAVQRLLSGRVERRDGRAYRYPGLAAEGALRVGQSVVLLDPDLADRLVAKLQEFRIRYTLMTVFVE